jgi:hypothetical protein
VSDPTAELQAWSLGPVGYPCHQFVVDATAARTASPTDKPIRLAFALAGLYLHVELGLDGPAIQRTHQAMAAGAREWPRLDHVPADGASGPAEILALPEADRPTAIDAWSAEVWADYADVHDEIRALVDPWR